MDVRSYIREQCIPEIRRYAARVSTATARIVSHYGPPVGGIIVACFFFASTYTYFGIYQPSAFFPVRTIVTIPEGVNVLEAAHILHDSQVIRSPFAFRAAIRFTSTDGLIKAGDYYFDRPLTLLGVAQRVLDGEHGLEPVKIVIPEGSSTYQMADLFARKFEKFDPVSFLLLAEHKEGYLYPDTYLFLPNVTSAQVLDTLERTFYEKLRTLETDIATFGKPIHEIVTMASLLEKEAYDHNDRLHIAGVLWHRIDIDMALQVDAVFGFIEKTDTFNPTFDDLKVESPYNTYTHKGLPPGPIGSPSLSSLEAAVKPLETDALFYLHGQDGVLRLAQTYDQHLVNRRMYLD